MAATLAYAVFFVTVGATLFTTGKIPLESLLASIPSLETLWSLVRALPEFLGQVVKAAFGKNQELSFPRTLAALHARDVAFEAAMDKAFSESTFPFSPKLAAFP